MKVILNIQGKIEAYKSVYERFASRGIIISKGKILLIQSTKYGEYKFPGGGIKSGESNLDALKREVLEETGKKVIPETIQEYGMVIENKMSNQVKQQLFSMISYYYIAQVYDTQFSTKLDLYEIEYGYHAKYVAIEEAISKNTCLLENVNEDLPWLKRETEVLKNIRENFKKDFQNSEL